MDNYVTMSVLFAITAKLDAFARSASIKCMEKVLLHSALKERMHKVLVSAYEYYISKCTCSFAHDDSMDEDHKSDCA